MIYNLTCPCHINLKLWKLLSRSLKTKNFPDVKTINFSETINLPKTKFPTRLNQKQRVQVEENVREKNLNGLYDWQRKHLSSEYSLHDGPIFANGNVHIGHAVNKILKDIILKQNIINGTRVLYSPGWDCHGLPIELKAVNTKLSSPVEIREHARKFASETIEKQKISFRTWGMTASWNFDDTYRTFDKKYIQNQLQMFYEMYSRELIYRDLKPVYYSPSSQSVLAEAELEYDDNFISPSLYFQCKITNPSELGCDEAYALIWTTTPWTLLGNQAICFNENLKYILAKIINKNFIICANTIENLCKELETEIEYIKDLDIAQLKNLTYEHPIIENEILPFFEATHVNAKKGSGLVHTSPSNAQDDFLVFLNKKISLKNYITSKGFYNEYAPEFLKGKEASSEGNETIIDYMKEKGNILKLNKLKHSYPIDWRTKRPVIIIASEQWFINTEKIKDLAISQLEKINFYPEKTKTISKSMFKVQLEKRPYWCISRQRSWGVPIPVLYDKNNKTIVDKRLIDFWIKEIDKTNSIDFWWKYDLEKLIPKEFTINTLEVKKGEDIFDVWVDSGLSWSHLLGKNNIADLFIEGVDQFSGWFQSSLLTSVGIQDIAPYKNIFVHGFTVDEKGRKMSKSLGNIIDPDMIVKKFGVDVLRWWIAAHATQHSIIPVSEKLLEESANNLVKIRATIKYLLGFFNNIKTTELDTEQLTHLDKFILHQLSVYIENVKMSYKTFQFNRIVALANNFVNTELSSNYLHLIKDRLYCGSDEEYQSLQKILFICYRQLAKSLWPIAPFLIEESWSYFQSSNSFYQNNSNSEVAELYKFMKSKEIIDNVFDVKKKLFSTLSDTNISKLKIVIEGNEDFMKDLMPLQPLLNEEVNDSELCEIFQVSSVKLKLSSIDKHKISYESSDEDLCPRCRRRFQSSIGICKKCENILEVKKCINI